MMDGRLGYALFAESGLFLYCMILEKTLAVAKNGLNVMKFTFWVYKIAETLMFLH